MRLAAALALSLAVLATPATARAQDAPLFPPPPQSLREPVLAEGSGSEYYRRGPLHHGFDLILAGGFGGRFEDEEREGAKLVLSVRAQEAVALARGVRADRPGIFGAVGVRTLGFSAAYAEAGGGVALLSFDHHEGRVSGFSVGWIGALATAGVDAGEAGAGGRLVIGLRAPVAFEIGGGAVAVDGSIVGELFLTVGGAPISSAF